MLPYLYQLTQFNFVFLFTENWNGKVRFSTLVRPPFPSDMISFFLSFTICFLYFLPYLPGALRTFDGPGWEGSGWGGYRFFFWGGANFLNILLAVGWGGGGGGWWRGAHGEACPASYS